jgi:hypothetical protein
MQTAGMLMVQNPGGAPGRACYVLRVNPYEGANHGIGVGDPVV